MEKQFGTFEELNCWKACRDLRVFVAKEVLPILPKHERYRLGDQILRAAARRPLILPKRFHFMDNAKFCSNARGSCYKVLDRLITAKDEDLK